MRRGSFNRIILIPMLFLTLNSISYAQTPNPIQAACTGYLENVKKSQALRGRVLLEVLRLYSRTIDNDIKPELQTLYALPSEDPVYNSTAPLFMKGFTSMEWDGILDGQKMSVVQKHKNSYLHITPIDTTTSNDESVILRKMQSNTESETRFTLYPLGSKHESKIMRLMLPEEIVEWHYIPSLWFPTPSQIGFPQNMMGVETKGGNKEPYAFIYTPVQLEPKLIKYLIYLSGNPNLTLQDITVILTIDSEHYTCKSLMLMTTYKGQKKSLLNLTHVTTEQLGKGLWLPTVSSIIATRYTEKEGQLHWNNAYFAQINLKHFEQKK